MNPVPETLMPCLPMRGLVAFPGASLNFELTRDVCKKAVETASHTDNLVFLVCQVNPEKEKPTGEDLHRIGSVARIKQYIKSPDGSVRALFEVLHRAIAGYYTSGRTMLRASIAAVESIPEDYRPSQNDALIRSLTDASLDLMKYTPKLSSEVQIALRTAGSLAELCDFIGANLLVRPEDKQLMLSKFDPEERARLALSLLATELEILKAELTIRAKVKASMDKNQRDYYLREQMKAIEEELGEEDEEIEEYQAKLAAVKAPDHVLEKLNKEIGKLSKYPYTSAEASVIRNYLDTVLDIPWGNFTKDRTDVAKAKQVLDRDHYGITKVKERIIEYLSVRALNPDAKTPVICLVGPPGVGKTSVASSVAEAMGRTFVRASLGGTRDEADIRGHRKTYIGAMPGRIIDALIKSRSMNPLILLDEVDKMGADSRGDPAAALLEVFDSEQNKTFRDHFVEVDVDLSSVVFICTANTLSTVPRPLIDRMEIIELDSYTRTEKLQIAKRHLVKKQRKATGMVPKLFSIDDEALLDIIDNYTHEAGVRNLERVIGAVMRKAAARIADGSAVKVAVKRKNLKEFITERRAIPTVIDDTDAVGTVNGLAYTEVGGDLLKIEVAVLDGTGKIELTGSLGDVMKESAKAAVTYVRSICESYGIDPSFHKNKDLHIHVPEGAVPKDGPSAGVTMMTAVLSALSGIPVRRDVAMTGEITLRGRVLAIGGLKEKTAAAFAAGVKTVCIPRDNESDLKDIDPEVRNGLNFVTCKSAEDVLKAALVMRGSECANEMEFAPPESRTKKSLEVRL